MPNKILRAIECKEVKSSFAFDIRICVVLSFITLIKYGTYRVSGEILRRCSRLFSSMILGRQSPECKGKFVQLILSVSNRIERKLRQFYL